MLFRLPLVSVIGGVAVCSLAVFELLLVHFRGSVYKALANRVKKRCCFRNGTYKHDPASSSCASVHLRSLLVKYKAWYAVKSVGVGLMAQIM